MARTPPWIQFARSAVLAGEGFSRGLISGSMRRMDCNRPKQLADWDKAHCWHPFTQMKDWCAEDHDPIILSEGRGAILRDTQGREYLDGNSSIWTNLHGHAHPVINAAIRDQLEKVAHVSYLGSGNEPASELAARLVELFPAGSLERVFFSDDGSTAVEVAIKMTAQYWQLAGKPERAFLVAFDLAYHGDTVGAASLGGISVFHDRFARYHFPVLRVKSVEELAALPELARGEVAGVILEPLVQAVAGIRLWPQGMLRELRQLCDRHDTFLILDEIMTGFGRTGTMFACEQEDVVPDFICLAKGLTGGYLPLAATLTTRRVFEGFLGNYEELKAFFYGHSYTANPLGCAAALASLDLFRTEGTLERIGQMSLVLADALSSLQDHPNVGEIRQIGLVAGIDLVANRETGEGYPWTAATGARVCQAARNFGLLTRPIRDTVVLMPPYCMTDSQIRQCLAALRSGIDLVC